MHNYLQLTQQHSIAIYLLIINNIDDNKVAKNNSGFVLEPLVETQSMYSTLIFIFQTKHYH